MLCRDVADHYCGKTIQNEMLDFMAKNVVKHITKRLKAADCYSVILDCMPDISHTVLMSITVRFLDATDGTAHIQEHFIGFKAVSDTTEAGLTESILSALQHFRIKMEDWRGQGDDNGAHTMGKSKGCKQEFLS